MFRFDFIPIKGFDLFVTGRSQFLLSERLLLFNNVMITLTRARWSARIVELASGKYIVINNASAQSAIKFFLSASIFLRYNSIGISPKFQDGYQNNDGFS